MRLSPAARTLLILALLAIVIRSLGLFQVAAYDEHCWLGWNECKIWHPPLSQLVHLFFRQILGAHDWVARLVVLSLGMINLGLVYLLSKKLYDERSALCAAALMAFGAYPILASLQIDIDGSFLLLFYLLTTLSFIEYEKTKKNLWLILCGVSFGMSLLSKYTGLFIILIIGIYHLIKERKFCSTLKTSVIISIIGVMIFSLFPLISGLAHSNLFKDSIAHLQNYAGTGGMNFSSLIIQYLLLLLWIGPLFIGLLFLSLTKPKKQNLLPWIWIIIIILLYTFINRDNFKPIERYLMVLVAPFSMIGGNYLSRLNLGKKRLLLLIITLLISFSSLLSLNSNGIFTPFYPKSEFISRVLSLDWNFYLPVTGSSGPIGFYLNFRAVAFGFALSALCILISLILTPKKTRHASAWFITLFLAISLSYNLFIAQEYLLGATAPNINEISRQVIDYSLDHGLNKPIYVFRNYALKYYLRDKYGEINSLDFDIGNDAQEVNKVIETGGTVVVIDFPKINEKSAFWQKLQDCSLVQDFSDKGVKIGYIFDCSQSSLSPG